MPGREQYGDPVGVYQFTVEIQGLQVGGFSEVSGLEAELETEQIFEGGLNNVVHNLPKKIKNGRLILKKGICICGTLDNWFNEIKNGTITKRDITVSLYDSDITKRVNSNDLVTTPVQVWNFVGAYPVKYSGPRLVAQNSNEVAIEAIEFVYHEVSCCKDKKS